MVTLENIFRILINSVYFQNIVVCNESFRLANFSHDGIIDKLNQWYCLNQFSSLKTTSQVLRKYSHLELFWN